MEVEEVLMVNSYEAKFLNEIVNILSKKEDATPSIDPDKKHKNFFLKIKSIRKKGKGINEISIMSPLGTCLVENTTITDDVTERLKLVKIGLDDGDIVFEIKEVDGAQIEDFKDDNRESHFEKLNHHPDKQNWRTRLRL
jgi:hypothetical protein